ncbi:hypothetical protein OAB57_03615 [Bacteriovoracaceae bacterium]|nr:hypothetical protein [Bacteriovoracaceae bacterium]
MEINVCYLRSEKQVCLRKIGGGNDEKKIIDLAYLREESPKVVFYSEASGDISGLIEDSEVATWAYGSGDQYNMPTYEEFFDMEEGELLNIGERVASSWILQNNLKTIDGLAPIVSKLKELWQDDRQAFFLELWTLLFLNFGANDLKMIFHDLSFVEDEKTGKDKKNLELYTSFGDSYPPTIEKSSDVEKKIMDFYIKSFTDPFTMVSWDDQKGEMVAIGLIEGNTVVLMGKLRSLGQLQRGLARSIFGLLSI